MTKQRVDVMVDLETLGNRPDATIFQIAASAFDITNGDIIADFEQKADLSLGDTPLTVDPSTISWWLRTNPRLFARLISEGTVSTEELLRKFHEWLSNLSKEYDVRLWGNGILFDNNFIRTQFEALGLYYPINYNRDRDVRTILELAANKLGVDERSLRKQFEEGLTAHDAGDDVTKQINLVVYCNRELTYREEE